MKRFSVAALLAFALLAPAFAQAQTSSEELREVGANATWQQIIDQEGNITFVSVVVVEQKTKPRETAVEPTLAVSIFRVDPEGSVLFSGFGTTNDFIFTTDNNLMHARTVGSVPFFDENTGTIVWLDIDVTWEGTGPLVTDSVDIKDKEKPCRFRFTAEGQMRQAVATGDIIVTAVDPNIPPGFGPEVGEDFLPGDVASDEANILTSDTRTKLHYDAACTE